MVVLRRVCLARVAVGVMGDVDFELYGIRLHEDFGGNQREPVHSASATKRQGNRERIPLDGGGIQLVFVRAPRRCEVGAARTEDDIARRACVIGRAWCVCYGNRTVSIVSTCRRAGDDETEQQCAEVSHGKLLPNMAEFRIRSIRP